MSIQRFLIKLYSPMPTDRNNAAFLHEIGLFPCHPPGDVFGFNRNKVKNCPLCGMSMPY